MDEVCFLLCWSSRYIQAQFHRSHALALALRLPSALYIVYLLA